MVEVDVLKNDEANKEYILSRGELSKLSKEELINKVIQLSDCKEAQENFILNISHDLRSPLNIILSILQCYKDDYKDIINLIEWNISSMDKYAKQKNIVLVFDTNVEECIMAIDPEAIDRIIMNLISNAIKFSPSGSSIYINTWKSINQLTISIKDEGMGIPKDEQDTIFNRFVQSSKNKSNENFGSGIGLDLVRYLTKSHNGSIELRSEENIGSEFIRS